MFRLSDIKEQIKTKPISFVYKVSSPTDFKLIFKTNGKNESKQKIKEKYFNKKLDESTYFIICKITFHSGKKFSQGGPIAANFDVYALENNKPNKLVNIMKAESNKFTHLENIKGIVWFDKLFLEKKGWDYKYIDNIIKKLIKGKLVLIQRTLYHVKFI